LFSTTDHDATTHAASNDSRTLSPNTATASDDSAIQESSQPDNTTDIPQLNEPAQDGTLSLTHPSMGDSFDTTDLNKPPAEDDQPTTANTAQSILSSGIKILGDHDQIDDGETAMLNVTEFLMYCALDDAPKSGLQKAFAVFSDREDGALSIGQVYKMLHYFLVLVDETNRFGIEQIADPVPYVRPSFLFLSIYFILMYVSQTYDKMMILNLGYCAKGV
jgi:hypothetical protein